MRRGGKEMRRGDERIYGVWYMRRGEMVSRYREEMWQRDEEKREGEER